jgi:acyl-CoA synthetase (NDP forming)
MQKEGRSLAQPLFSPRSVALVGASADATKNNARPQRFLRAHGYTGRILPINPGRDEIFGERAYPDVRSAPGPIDHAFIMVPAKAVPEVIDQLCDKAVPVATIFSAGFAELGEEGLARQRAMVERARAGGLRLIGPNCMGVVNVTGHVALSINAVLADGNLRSGPLSVISQSGSMLGTLLSRAQPRGLGFSKLVSLGNECDLGVGEIANLLVDDPDTGAILLFLETFRDAHHLAHAARRAHLAGKPVIAFKLGRSEVGRRAAASHTGAMVGGDELANAFFRAHGILRVDMMESLFELPMLVAGHRPPKGRRVAVLTGTGGAAAMVADRLGVLGAEVVPPPAAMIERLRAQDLPINDSPITDIPMGGSDKGAYTAILSALLDSDHCDAVVSVIGSSSKTNPQVVADRVLKANPRNKPLAVFLAPLADEGLALLHASAVAGFRTPESCADSVNTYLNWRMPVPECALDDRAIAAANGVLRGLQGQGDAERLNERDAGALFGALGIATAPAQVVKNASEKIEVAGPVAVKLLSPDILHKTDAGMVHLNVAGTAIGEAVASLLERAATAFAGARVDGVLVQSMAKGLAEVILGFRRDPELGPVVMLGSGGVMAELRKSYSVRLAPVSLESAHEMIDEVPEFALLQGFRNLPRGDVDALAHAVQAMSMLAAVDARAVAEAEINPLIVKAAGEGVVAVDGLVVFDTNNDTGGRQ